MILTRTPTTNEKLLARSAKAFATLYLGIEPRVWILTQDQAWVRIVERLLTVDQSRHAVTLTRQAPGSQENSSKEGEDTHEQ